MNTRVARTIIVCGLCVIIGALSGCAAGRAPERFKVDLLRCSIEGHSLDEVLRWTPDTLDFDSPRYKLFEQLSLAGPQVGVYLGHCTIDNVTGQAMVIDLRQGTERLQLIPPIGTSSDRAQVESYFGLPVDGYRPSGFPAGTSGSRGEWRNVCPGYVLKIQFDVQQRPRSLTLQPF